MDRLTKEDIFDATDPPHVEIRYLYKLIPALFIARVRSHASDVRRS